MSHVSDLELEDLQGVQPHLISKLRHSGIQSVLDLAVSVPQELAAGGEGITISADTETISELVLKAKKALVDSGALIKEFSTADQVLERRKSLVRFTTGSKNLDDFLKGGVESQAITELAGEFGSGKSQIYHTLCVTAAKGTRGPINSIIFVDTENTFRPERVHQIAEARGLDSEEIMKKVFVCKIVNSAQLEALIRNLGSISKNTKLNLLLLTASSLFIELNILDEKLWLKDSRDLTSCCINSFV
jgi:DNA repair protein RadA